MLQIVFRFLEEILWCSPDMIQNINLLIQKQANMMLLEVFKDFQQLCNLFESRLILSHNATDDICENLFYGLTFVCFTKKKIHLPMLLLWIVNQSRNHCNVCAYQRIGGGVILYGCRMRMGKIQI